MLTSLVVTILVLALVGFLIWIITTYIPMPDLVKTLIYVVVAVVVVLYLLQMLTGHAALLR